MQKESISRVKEINYLCRGFFQVILLFFRDQTRMVKRNNFKLRSLKAFLLWIPNFIHFLLQAVEFCFGINSPVLSSSFFGERLRQFWVTFCIFSRGKKLSVNLLMLSLSSLNWKKAYLPTIARDKATDFNSAPLDKLLFMSWVQPVGIFRAATTVWNRDGSFSPCDPTANLVPQFRAPGWHMVNFPWLNISWYSPGADLHVMESEELHLVIANIGLGANDEVLMIFNKNAWDTSREFHRTRDKTCLSAQDFLCPKSVQWRGAHTFWVISAVF